MIFPPHNYLHTRFIRIFESKNPQEILRLINYSILQFFL